MTTGYATLHETQTVYSLRDVYSLIDLFRVNNHNRRVWSEHDAARNRQLGS